MVNSKYNEYIGFVKTRLTLTQGKDGTHEDSISLRFDLFGMKYKQMFSWIWISVDHLWDGLNMVILDWVFTADKQPKPAASLI